MDECWYCSQEGLGPVEATMQVTDEGQKRAACTPCGEDAAADGLSVVDLALVRGRVPR